MIDFFEDEVLNTFPLNSCKSILTFPDARFLPDTFATFYSDTFDIYFTRSNDRIFIIDFNPYAPQTASYLFSWSEILSLSLSNESESESLPLVRIVTSETMSNQPSFAHNRYPKDVVDTSSGASIAEFAEKWKAKLAEGVKTTLEEREEGSR